MSGECEELATTHLLLTLLSTFADSHQIVADGTFYDLLKGFCSPLMSEECFGVEVVYRSGLWRHSAGRDYRASCQIGVDDLGSLDGAHCRQDASYLSW